MRVGEEAKASERDRGGGDREREGERGREREGAVCFWIVAVVSTGTQIRRKKNKVLMKQSIYS